MAEEEQDRTAGADDPAESDATTSRFFEPAAEMPLSTGLPPAQALPLAQRLDYSHFAVVRTKLKWNGGAADAPKSS